MLHRCFIALFTLSAIACATPPAAPSIDAPILVPTAQESIVIDQLVVLLDASSSVSKSTIFRDQKTLAESFARSAPNGDYETSVITFGGFRRETTEPARFDRARLVGAASGAPHFSEGSPIHKAIGEAGDQIAGKTGRAAVLLYSDGVLTSEGGKDLDPQLALDAATELARTRDGSVCFHAVQVGNDPAGADLLRAIAGTTDCGTFRQGEGITSVAALQQFEREVFLGASPTPDVAAAPRDTDRDGVLDGNDACPGTPLGAGVDPRGCWVVKGLHFATDSAAVGATGKRGLDEVIAVLEQNPELRVRIAGYTDSTGSENYNVNLSDRRAAAARDYLVAAGVDASRLDSQGYGENNPIADNATADGRSQNRRTAIEILR